MRRLVVATAVLVAMTGTSLANNGYGYYRSCEPIIDANGCDVSPTTYKACAKDIKQDLKELACDIRNGVKAAFRGNGTVADAYFDAAQSVLADIRQDSAVLATLNKKKG